MSIESQKIEKSDKEVEPIIDIKLNKATLESWEKQGLSNDIHTLLDGDFERFIPPGEKFVLSPDMFACTDNFIKNTERAFSIFKAKNLDEKLKEVENQARKAILNFTFKELEVGPQNLELIKQEIVKQNSKEKIIKYFKTNQPRIALGSDGTNWWLENRAT